MTIFALNAARAYLNSQGYEYHEQLAPAEILVLAAEARELELVSLGIVEDAAGDERVPLTKHVAMVEKISLGDGTDPTVITLTGGRLLVIGEAFVGLYNDATAWHSGQPVDTLKMPQEPPRCVLCSRVIRFDGEHPFRSILRDKEGQIVRSWPFVPHTALYRDTTVFCQECAGIVESEEMVHSGTSKDLIYDDKQFMVANWNGHLVFKVEDYRTSEHVSGWMRHDIWFDGPDGHVWHGFGIGDERFGSVQLTCRSTKEVYEWQDLRCKSCNHHFEVYQVDDLTACLDCGQRGPDSLEMLDKDEKEAQFG